MTADKVPAMVGVGVAIDQHPVGGEALKNRVELFEHPPGHHPVRAATDPQVHVGVRDAELDEERVGHVHVVVLPGVDDLVVDAGRVEGLGHGGQLDELGPGSHDADDAHISS